MFTKMLKWLRMNNNDNDLRTAQSSKYGLSQGSKAAAHFDHECTHTYRSHTHAGQAGNEESFTIILDEPVLNMCLIVVRLQSLCLVSKTDLALLM